MPLLNLSQVTEASDRYGGLLQAAKRARQQASSLESLRDQMADLAEQQLELVGCALQGVDGADPELKIPELEEELLDKEEEFSELRDLHEAMLERSPRAKAQAIKAVHSAVRQKHLLAREQQRFRAEQLDAEARITAARVTETAINNIVMRDVMQEAASRNAAVSRLAADAAADIAATAIHKAQGLLGRSAALDADMSVMDGDSPHGMHTYVDTLAEMKKQGSQAHGPIFLPIAALTTSEPTLQEHLIDRQKYEMLKQEEQVALRQLRYRLCQLKVIETTLLSSADAGLLTSSQQLGSR